MRPYTLTTQKTKNYIELKNSEIAHQHTHNTQPPTEPSATCVLDARNHYPQIKHHTPPPKRGDNNQTSASEADPALQVNPPPVSHTRDEEVTGLLSQSPIVCLAIPHRKIQPKLNPVAAQRLLCTKPGATTAHGFLTAHTPTNWGCLSWCSLERR